MCKFSADQQWYDVTVDAITPHGYMVTYVSYGNSEEVPLEYLRPSGDASGKTAKASQKKVDELIKIPESLKILPTDTEEVCDVMLIMMAIVIIICSMHSF